MCVSYALFKATAVVMVMFAGDGNDVMVMFGGVILIVKWWCFEGVLYVVMCGVSLNGEVTVF